MIEESLISEVRQKNDIVEIISEYVPLKLTGKTYKGLCPFHKEKTPSFYVHPEKQIYHCFGCGVGGNVFTFLMNYHNRTFFDVLKELANRVGVTLEYNFEKSEEEKQKDIIRKINKIAMEFYKWLLEHKTYGEAPVKYLRQRGINLETQTKFCLGYAQNSWDSLTRYMTNHCNFTYEQLELAGLVIKREDTEGYYDRFRNRLIFPIFDINGDVIAFGGRTLIEGQTKYINSPETPLYKKGDHLYGLNFAKEHIRRKDRVVLVEGYMDVITAHQYGFFETVGTLGTALTETQAKKLIQFTPSKKVIVAYDSDKAGINAATKGVEILEEVTMGTGIDINIIQIPTGKDPDEYLHLNGDIGFERLLNGAKPLIEFLLEQVINNGDLTTLKGKTDVVKNCLPIISKISDQIYRDECIKIISNKLKIKEDSLRRELSKFYTRYKSRDSKVVENKIIEKKLDKVYISEQGLLFLMVEYSEICEKILTEIIDIKFEDEIHEKIRHIIVEIIEKSNILDWQTLLDRTKDVEIASRIVEIMNREFMIDNNNILKILDEFIKTVYFNGINKAKRKLEYEIEILSKQGEHERIKNLLHTIQDLNKKIHTVKI